MSETRAVATGETAPGRVFHSQSDLRFRRMRTPKGKLVIDLRLFKHQNLHNFTLVFSHLKPKYICFIYLIF